MSSFRSRRNLVPVALALVVFGFSAAIFAGCQGVKSGASAMVSAQGVKLESLLPNNTLMVFKVGSSLKSQQENLQKILANFPKEGVENFVKGIMSDFDKQLEADGLSVEKDFVPALGDNFQAMAGFMGSIGEQSPDSVVLIPLADIGKADLIFDKLAAKGEYQKTIYKDFPIYAKTDTYIGRYKDILLVSNQLSLIQRGIEKVGSNDTLLQSDRYQKAISKASDSFGFFYLDAKQFFAQVAEKAGQDGLTQQVVKDSKAVQNTEGEVFAFYMEPDGIRFKVYVYANGDAGFADAPMHEPYLFASVRDSGTFFYSELYNLKKILEINSKTFDNIPEFKNVGANLNLVLAMQGIDKDKDLMSFLDKGIALQIHAVGGLIPGLGIYIDASSSPASAAKILKKINDLVNAYLPSVNQGDVKLVTNEVVNVAAGSAEDSFGAVSYKLVLHMDKLPSKELDGMPNELLGDKVLDYGLDKNGILSFKLNPAVGQNLPYLKDNKEFVSSRELIKGFDQGVTYLEIAPLVDYIFKVVEFSQLGAGAAEGDVQIMDAAKAYFSPVKSFVFASAKPSSSEVEMQGFLHIGNF